MATEPEKLTFKEKRQMIKDLLSGLLTERTNMFVRNNFIHHDVSTPKSNPVQQSFRDNAKETKVTTLSNTITIPTEKHDGQSNTNVLSEPGQYVTAHEDSVKEMSTLAPQNITNPNPFATTAIEPFESERNLDDYQSKATEVTTTVPETENSCRSDLLKCKDSHQHEKNPFGLLEVENLVPSNDRSNNVLGSNKKDFDKENVKISDQLRPIPAEDSSLPKEEHIPNKNNVTDKNQSYDSNEIMKTKNNSERIKEGSPVQIDLLLIGKTGNGKSALGNSILNRKVFRSDNSTSSVTKIVQKETSEVSGRIVTVVDGPGVGDTEIIAEHGPDLVIEALSSAVAENPRGFHAFLIVLRYGVRFTLEEQKTIIFLKLILGKNVFRKFGILVMTCGDLLEKETDFQKWVLRQMGYYKDLVRECKNRIILFDNKTKDKAKKERQFNELMKIIDHLIMENCRYSNEEFELARSIRHEIILESKKPVIAEETMLEANLIMQGIASHQDKFDDDSIMQLKGLLARAMALHENLLANDNRTGLLTDLISHVETVKNTIVIQIQVSEKLVDIHKRMEEKELQLQRKHAQDVMTLKNELNELYLEQKAEENRKHMVMEEKLQKEIEECEAKNKSLANENGRLFQRLKDIEISNRKNFLSKLQSKISNAFKRKIKEKQLKSQTEFYKKMDSDDEQDDEKSLRDT